MATGEYEGRKVKLDDPFRLPSGSKKKFGVYVKNPDTGNIIMVKYGDPNLSIKRDEPGRLKNFRARHNCDSPGPKTKARFWSCKFWEKGKPVSKLLKQGKVKEDSCDCGCDVHEDTHWKDKNDEREHNKLFMQSLKVMPGSPKQKKIVQQMNALRKKNGLELLGEEAYLPGQATTSHGGKSGRGGKPGPRMSRQRKNRAAVLDHLILNGIRVLNQPADVRQKGSSDTFVVAKKDLKRATDVVDDYFSKPYVKIHMRKNQLRRENYKIVTESVSEEEKRIPRKPGQPAKSKQHSDLYTDENPEGTIHGLGFKDVKTAKASVQKIKSSDRTHAHKVQAAVAMEQRAREMGKKEEAAVYRSFIDFMKEKTKKMNEEKKFYTKKGKIKQSPEDKESGLPKKYVSGLSDKEAKQKAKEIKKRMSLPKDHPDAYKPVDDVEDPGIIDKKKKEKKSASTTKFQKAFGESFKEFVGESKIKGLQNKADKTGVSYTILKKVYDRGMEAWRSGHRPGIGQHQWAFARVNSFLTGGKTQKTADKDLWAKVPEGKKRGIKAKLKGGGKKK